MRKINQTHIDEKWYVIDATGLRLGRIATIAAELLLGKNNPLVKDYLIPKNKVIITNASKFDSTPKRKMSKLYTAYSGYPGGLRVDSLEVILKRKPTQPLEHAIKGMLPKNIRGNEIFRNLFVYDSNEHPHEAQKPESVDIKKIKI